MPIYFINKGDINMKELIKDIHVCRIFDMIKTSDTTFVCQTCKKTHDQKSFQELKKETPTRICHCGGIAKKMSIHIPTPISGYETHTIYYTCLYCGAKYMFHKFKCDTENCSNYCDISEIYCWSCRQNMK